MKNELKTQPCLKRFQTRMQIFLICILIKQQKHMVINNFNHTFHETNFTKLFTANLECNGTGIKLPKTEKTILFLNLNSRSMVATSCFVSVSTFNFCFSFNTSDLKWHRRWKFYQTKCTRYLRIALTTHFSSSSLVLGGLNLHSVICFAKQRVCSELTNRKVTTRHQLMTIQKLWQRSN